MAGDAELVTRPELLERIVGEGADGAGALWDVRGIVGAGKTVLLREVERRAGEDDVVMWVEARDLTVFDQEHAVPGAAVSPEDELRRISRVLSSASKGLWNSPRDADAEPAGVAEQTEQFQSAAGRLIRELSEAGGRVYVLIDNFEHVSHGPLEEWLLELVAGLRGAVVVVARRVDGPGEPALAGAAPLDVGGLTAEQVRDYLVRRLGSQGAEIAAKVYGFTGGHALAVGLTVDLVVAQQRRGQSVGDLILQLATGHDDPRDLQNRLLKRLLESADPVLREGLDCLWAVRRFDSSLLKRLLEECGVAGGHRLAEQLVAYSFVEKRIPPGRPNDEYHVVHDHVRQQARKQSDSGRLSQLAGVGQLYYQEQMTDFLNDYEGWFRYEDPAWQAMVREWLYLVAQLNGDGEREDARVGMAELFLDAFWWFGNYVHFPFCGELLADWTEIAVARKGPADKEDIAEVWGGWLRELYLRYPKGWRRQASPEDWLAVRTRLNDFLNRRPELNAKRAERHKKDEGTKRSVRRVRALMNVYLADAERYLDPGSARPEKLLLEAHQSFTQDEDDWDAAWMYFQRADAALGRGDLGAAVAIAEDGWRALAEGDDDPELAANFHRIHADAAWERGDRGLALDLYARAALLAYRFQVNSVNPKLSPLDEYTQAFLTEMHERAAERLAALHAAGDRQVIIDACARIREFFHPYWRDLDAAGMAGLDGLAGLLDQRQTDEAVRRLFPPPPVSADLHGLETAYSKTATQVLDEMVDELTKLPGTPLRPAGSGQ
jgi:hypothetical protein